MPKSTDVKSAAEDARQQQIDAFVERLQRAFDASGLSKSELARKVGVAAPQPGRWLKKEAMPRGDVMLQLPAVLDVSAAWLLLGTEPGEEVPATQRARNAERGMAHIIALAAEYRRANRERRELRWPSHESEGIPPAPLKYFRRSDEYEEEEEERVGPRAEDQG